ncbi:MAG: hypothetical protein HC814_06380 [Rhodobacteraceae bacterium]|nr:hypothetical protein [Paracoccaceae bacterium]
MAGPALPVRLARGPLGEPRLVRCRALRLVRHIRAIEGRLMEFYLGRPRRFFAAVGLQFCNWCMGAVEIYLVLHFLGAPIPFVYALVIESVVVLVRTALFFHPLQYRRPGRHVSGRLRRHNRISRTGGGGGSDPPVPGAVLDLAGPAYRLGLLAETPTAPAPEYNELDRKLDRGHMASGR